MAGHGRQSTSTRTDKTKRTRRFTLLSSASVWSNPEIGARKMIAATPDITTGHHTGHRCNNEKDKGVSKNDTKVAHRECSARTNSPSTNCAKRPDSISHQQTAIVRIKRWSGSEADAPSSKNGIQVSASGVNHIYG